MANESKGGKATAKGKQAKSPSTEAKKKKGGAANKKESKKVGAAKDTKKVGKPKKTDKSPKKSTVESQSKSSSRNAVTKATSGEAMEKPSNKKVGAAKRKGQKVLKPEAYKSKHNIGRRTAAGRVGSYKETEISVVFPDGYWSALIKAEENKAAASVAKSPRGRSQSPKGAGHVAAAASASATDTSSPAPTLAPAPALVTIKEEPITPPQQNATIRKRKHEDKEDSNEACAKDSLYPEATENSSPASASGSHSKSPGKKPAAKIKSSRETKTLVNKKMTGRDKEAKKISKKKGVKDKKETSSGCKKKKKKDKSEIVSKNSEDVSTTPSRKQSSSSKSKDSQQEKSDLDLPKIKRPRFADIQPRAPRIKRTACLNANAIVSLMYEKEENQHREPVRVQPKRPRMDSYMEDLDYSESTDTESLDSEITFPHWKPDRSSSSSDDSCRPKVETSSPKKSPKKKTQKTDGEDKDKEKKKKKKKKKKGQDLEERKSKKKKKKKKRKSGYGEATTENGKEGFSPWSPPRRMASLNAQAILAACMDDRVKKPKGDSSAPPSPTKPSVSQGEEAPTTPASEAKAKAGKKRDPSKPRAPKKAKEQNEKHSEAPKDTVASTTGGMTTTANVPVTAAVANHTSTSARPSIPTRSPDVQIVEVKASPSSTPLPSSQAYPHIPAPRPSGYVPPVTCTVTSMYQPQQDYMRFPHSVAQQQQARTMGTQTSFPLPASTGPRHFQPPAVAHTSQPPHPQAPAHYPYQTGQYPPPQAHQSTSQYVRDPWSPHSTHSYRTDRYPYPSPMQFKDTSRLPHTGIRYPTPTPPPPTQSPFDTRMALAPQHHLGVQAQHSYPPNLYQPAPHQPAHPHYHPFVQSQPPPILTHALKQPPISPAPSQGSLPPQPSPPQPQGRQQPSIQPKPYHPSSSSSSSQPRPTYPHGHHPPYSPPSSQAHSQQVSKSSSHSQKQDTPAKPSKSTTQQLPATTARPSPSKTKTKDETKILYNTGGSQFHAHPEGSNSAVNFSRNHRQQPPQQPSKQGSSVAQVSTAQAQSHKPSVSQPPQQNSTTNSQVTPPQAKPPEQQQQQQAQKQNRSDSKKKPPPDTCTPDSQTLEQKPQTLVNNNGKPAENSSLSSSSSQDTSSKNSSSSSTPATGGNASESGGSRGNSVVGASNSQEGAALGSPAPVLSTSLVGGTAAFTFSSAPAVVPSNCQPFMVGTMSVATDGTFPLVPFRHYGSAFALPAYDDQQTQHMTFSYYQPAGPLIQALPEPMFMPHPMGLQGVPQPVKVLVHNAGFVGPGVCQEVMPDKAVQVSEATNSDSQGVLKTTTAPMVARPIAKALPMGKHAQPEVAVVKGEVTTGADAKVVTTVVGSKSQGGKSKGAKSHSVAALVPIAPAPAPVSLPALMPIAPKPSTVATTKVTTAICHPQTSTVVQPSTTKKSDHTPKAKDMKTKSRPPTQLVSPTLATVATTGATQGPPRTAVTTATVQPQPQHTSGQVSLPIRTSAQMTPPQKTIAQVSLPQRTIAQVSLPQRTIAQVPQLSAAQVQHVPHQPLQMTLPEPRLSTQVQPKVIPKSKQQPGSQCKSEGKAKTKATPRKRTKKAKEPVVSSAMCSTSLAIPRPATAPPPSKVHRLDTSLTVPHPQTLMPRPAHSGASVRPPPPPLVTITPDQPLNLSKSAPRTTVKETPAVTTGARYITPVTNTMTVSSSPTICPIKGMEKLLRPLEVSVTSEADVSSTVRRTSPRLASPSPKSTTKIVSPVPRAASAPGTNMEETKRTDESEAVENLKGGKPATPRGQPQLAESKISPHGKQALKRNPKDKDGAQKKKGTFLSPSGKQRQPVTSPKPKKESLTVSKNKEPVAKAKESTLKCKEPAPKSKDTSPKSKESTPSPKHQKASTSGPSQASPAAKQKKDESVIAKGKKEDSSGKKSPTSESAKRVSPGPKKRTVSSWEWNGDSELKPVFLRADSPTQSHNCFQSIRHKTDGDVIRERDCVLVKSGPRKRDIPFVAKICALWEKDGEMLMSVFWYYRPEHTETDKLPRCVPSEVFASKHRDVIPVNCIEDRCYVLTLNEYCRYKAELKRQQEGCSPRPPVVPPMDGEDMRFLRLPTSRTAPETVFLCRKVYDVKLKRVLKNPQIHTAP